MSQALPEAWQPLPPRKNRQRRVGTGESKSAGGNVTNGVDAVEGIPDDTEASTSVTKKAKTITDNIERRINQKWVHTTAKQGLESKDGVAGEFYEYLDHTADVQLHAWGATLEQAFSNIIPCMFNYLTDLNTVEIDHEKSIEFEVKGHDMDTLLFAYMDEFLFHFSTESFCCKQVEILSFDREQFSLKVKGRGETYDLAKHPQGTEIKAITYSNMQIHESTDKTDLYVIVDI